MERRLPVYLLLDVSGSMTGEPIEAVKNGMKLLLSSLKNEPQALETVWLSVITFGSVAKTVVPLTDLNSFQEPELQASGTTSMGAALKELQKSISNDIRKGDKTKEEKGDWKPLVFLLTDGEPNDDWQSALNDLDRKNIGVFVACGVQSANKATLESITGNANNVIELDTASAKKLQEFFQWVTASITSGVNSVGEGKEPTDINSLPPVPGEDDADLF